MILLDKKDYIVKMKDMAQDGINKGMYEDTQQDMKCFQDFLHRNL